MRRNPQRLAWAVLLASFGLCVALAISTPLLIRSFINDSVSPAFVVLESPRGTTLLRRPASPDVVGVVESTDDVPDGSQIRVDESMQALLTMNDPVDRNTRLATVKLFGAAAATLRAAHTPRFDASPNPYRLELFLDSGRMRINVSNDTPRAVQVIVYGPQGEATFGAGTYAIEVTNEELQVTVREGEAIVGGRQGQPAIIHALERAVVPLNQAPQGGLSNELDLIRDGGFAQPLERNWTMELKAPEIETESTGRVYSTTVAGRLAARFDRNGQGHGEVDLTQSVERDVTDSVSLQLHFLVFIDRHDVPLCGSVGSECPLMMRLRYRDTSGSEREWIQGFYVIGDPNPNPNPQICLLCSSRNPHTQIPPQSWYPYDSGNLLEDMAINGLKPAQIIDITFYASGHSFASAVTDVELLVQD
jgi:hypothetical protein